MNIIEDAQTWLVQRQQAREEAGAATGYVPPPTREEELIRDLHAALVDARAILEGRTTAPTHTEIEAHIAAGGAWVAAMRGCAILAETVGETYGIFEEVEYSWPDDYEDDEDEDDDSKLPAWRWWPLDPEGRPCAWPKVSP